MAGNASGLLDLKDPIRRDLRPLQNSLGRDVQRAGKRACVACCSDGFGEWRCFGLHDCNLQHSFKIIASDTFMDVSVSSDAHSRRMARAEKSPLNIKIGQAIKTARKRR